MSDHNSSATDKVASASGTLSFLSSMLDRLTLGLNILGSVLIVAMMLVVNADVIGRNLLAYPVSGVPELVSMSIVAIVFLQVAHAFRCGHLTRSLAFLNFVERRSARLRALLELLLCIGAGLIVLQLFMASWSLFLKAWTRNTYEGTIGSFTVAVWPVKLIILIGCLALTGQILIRTVYSLQSLWHGLPLPHSDSHD